MRHIQKKKEPYTLTEYRQKPDAHYDNFREKEVIKQSLLEEQGYLCAYCMCRINQSDIQIEHWKSRSEHSAHESLDYHNLLGVCRGNEGCGNIKHMTCDRHKGNTPLTINPLDSYLVDKIQYHRDGTIYSDTPKINVDLVNTLNLNESCLQRSLPQNRKAVLDICINQCIKFKKNGAWNKNMLLKVKKIYSGDESEKYIPYSGIALNYINRHLNKLR